MMKACSVQSTLHENLKSDGMATGNPADTNTLVWESEISRTAEQPLNSAISLFSFYQSATPLFFVKTDRK
jgi:hypothetical protein